VIFKTQSGSAYEVDLETQRIRRLYGVLNPTTRTGTDGVWKKYGSLTEIEVGVPVLIIWWGGELTATSQVIEILKQENLN
jgi:hypothetical protein